MPNWKKILGPLPRWRYALTTVLSLISAGVIAFTMRTIAVPWQTIPLGCGLAVICAAMRWFRDEMLSSVIDVIVIEGLFALGLHFYPSAVRDIRPIETQLAAVLVLPTLIALPILEHFGIIPKARTERFDEFSTDGRKYLKGIGSSPPVYVRRKKDQIVR